MASPSKLRSEISSSQERFEKTANEMEMNARREKKIKEKEEARRAREVQQPYVYKKF